jgi:hypothetical protein
LGSVFGLTGCTVDYRTDDERWRALVCNRAPAACDAGANGGAAGGSKDAGDAEVLVEGGTDGKPAEAGGGDAGAACTRELASEVSAIFVSSAAGSTAGDCGSARKPCSTIAQGLTRARSTSRGLVFVDTGTYAEPVVLVPGVTIRGGWDNVDGTWTRQCKAARSASAVIESPTNIGVLAEYDGTAGLETLTVRSKQIALAGESLYGVFARGAKTRLALNEVVLVVAKGGDGANGPAASAAPKATGTCAAADGAAGTPAGAVGPGGTAGRYDQTGYLRSDGQQGGAGTPGRAGALASDPECLDCYDRCSCRQSVCTPELPAGQSCGARGASGCGGAAGVGGGGGQGGGASIALFAWQAMVSINAGRFEAGAGGNGGPGGDPGAGGEGADGQPGTIGPDCYISNCPARGSGTGTTGGNGGRGSSGGRGGAGAGGHSYAVVQGGGAIVSVASSTELDHGEGGKSAGNGATGQAGTVFQVL